MNQIDLDIKNSLKETIGLEYGLDLDSLLGVYGHQIDRAFKEVKELQKGHQSRNGEDVRFWHLAQESMKKLPQIQQWANQVKGRFKNVVYIGIGGSYLGNRMLLEALAHPYQELKSEPGKPRVFFTGYNLDPIQLSGLLDVIECEETLFVVISKSGGTIEPMSHLAIVLNRLEQKKLSISQHIVAVTDDSKGILREFAIKNNVQTWSVPDGIGGRFSVLSDAGLVLVELAGISSEQLLKGAFDWSQMTQEMNINENASALYAFIHYLFDKEQKRNISVLMPYASGLKYLSEWYVQLLSESIGKRKQLQTGQWEHFGQTPVCAIGTTDMHSQTQQHIHGKHDKVITFIEIESFSDKEMTVPSTLSEYGPLAHLQNNTIGGLLNVALQANRLSLANENRPTVTIKVPEVSPYYLGQLIFFFEYAVAFQGALFEIDAFDQPGVEAYKKIMKERLCH